MSKCIVWVIFVSLVLCLAPLGAQTNTVTNVDTSVVVKATTNASGNNFGLQSLELEERYV